MGLDRHAIRFLHAARRLGADFDATLQLGRQAVTDGATPIAGRYAEPLLHHLGARTADSLDASDYEQATQIHDLNQPLPDHLRRRYSVVLDSGTLEHVYDVATAFEGVLDAVRRGGHFIAITPTNGWSGHGFYQFSPELYHALLPASGYRVRCMLIRGQHLGGRFYTVPAPAETGGRVPLRSVWPTMLYLLAQRVEERAPEVPRQIDYTPGYRARPSRRGQLKARLPHGVREPVSEAWSMLWTLRRFALTSPDFKPVRLDDLR